MHLILIVLLMANDNVIGKNFKKFVEIYVLPEKFAGDYYYYYYFLTFGLFAFMFSVFRIHHKIKFD